MLFGNYIGCTKDEVEARNEIFNLIWKKTNEI